MNAGSKAHIDAQASCLKQSVIITIVISGIIGIIGLLLVLLHLTRGSEVVSQGLLICGYILLGIAIVITAVSGLVCTCSLMNNTNNNMDVLNRWNRGRMSLQCETSTTYQTYTTTCEQDTDVMEMKDIIASVGDLHMDTGNDIHEV